MTRPPVVDVRCPRCGGPPLMYVPERQVFQAKATSAIDFRREIVLTCGHCPSCDTWWCAVTPNQPRGIDAAA